MPENEDHWLTNRVALVTGAGGGIGGAVARRLARSGAKLVLADIRADSLEGPSFEGVNLAESLTWAGDLTDEAGVSSLFGQIMERFGRLDIAVNTAGILRNTPFEEMKKAEWDRVMDVNAGTLFLVSRESVKLMRQNRWGRIVNFASVAGQVGGILAGAHYAAGKAAVISLTKSVAKLYAKDGVRCNAIAPCGVETEMLNEFTGDQQQVLRSGIPLGRFGSVDEMAEIAVWLCSPAADFITGQTINANGGVYMG